MSFWDLFFILLIWVPLAMIWVGAVMDIFRRHDMSGFSKAMWLVVVIFLPLFGTLIYMIVRPAQPAEIAYAQNQARAMTGASTTEELERIAKLRADGTITEDEFNRLKERALA